MSSPLRLFASSLLLSLFTALSAAPLTRDSVLADTLKPYAGPSVRGVDTSTLTGKVVCGYQGWFNAEGDGAELGFIHWTQKRSAPAPGNVKVDMWPDLSELTPAERFATGLKHADGRTAEVFSSFNRETVLRHFRWMKEYGLDGVMVQRFANGLRDPRGLRHKNTVLGHCREGANLNGRGYAVMYDLSGMGAGRLREVMDDWKLLRERMKITADPAYLKHRGKPLVSVWGVGFADDRAYSLKECRELVEFLKADGCTVMLGVPNHWREGTRDALADPELRAIIALADIVSPWTVGRYGTIKGVELQGEKVIKPDLAWCAERKLDYLPVVFPGFSWFNMKGENFNSIPRLKGQFLWSQFVSAKRAGASMIYVAMFDEVDEGTAIFKTSNEPPVGEGLKFLTNEGLPSDHYLRLTGAGTKLLRGEIPVTETAPVSAR